MSEYEFVDEDGNPIDPSELGDGYEIVDDVEPEQVEAVDYLDEILLDHDADDEVPELGLDGGEQSVTVVADDEPETVEIVEEVDDEPAPAAPSLDKAVEPQEDSPITLNRRAKLMLVGGAAAAVLLVGGGIAFALNGVGNQNTAADVKAGASSKYAQASEKVVSKSSEVRGEAASVAIDTCRVGKLGGGGGLGDAMADGGAEAPKLRLDVISASPLPGSFIAARTNADGKAGTPSLLQLTKSGWAAYTTVPLTKAETKAEVSRPGFHKVDVTVTDDKIAVTSDKVWAGGDTGGAGSCEPGEPGVYAASGKVPADAAGLVDGQASVDAIQGIAGEPDRAVAIMGNSVALVRLVENVDGGGDAASSSSKPSK
ncbi:hypothetical protein [Gordonia humi]|uniref:Uncharacterized protein n=1 Tax=Gordonia humi TaxID=686429 RepID=A0A840ESX2_9ACTN|nr:hypothetical protein [Gordonia humi]MBB4134792.1 hypothetical protein [Gordonia humi]